MWEASMYLRYSSVNGNRSTRVKKCYQKIWLCLCLSDHSWHIDLVMIPGWKCTVKLQSSGHIMVLRRLQHERIYAGTAVNRELSKTKNWKSCWKLCFPFVMDVEQRVKKFINEGLLKQLLSTEKEKKIHKDIFSQFNIHYFYATLLLGIYYSLEPALMQDAYIKMHILNT